jgi:ABC-type xylose transport system, permease component
MLAYTTLGTLAGLGGIILTARLNSATPDAGMGYELDCITAVVIGGTSLSGGKGTIAGTVAGIFIMVVLATSLNLLGVQSIYQYLSKGLILLIAVLIDSYLNRRRG